MPVRLRRIRQIPCKPPLEPARTTLIPSLSGIALEPAEPVVLEAVKLKPGRPRILGVMQTAHLGVPSDEAGAVTRTSPVDRLLRPGKAKLPADSGAAEVQKGMHAVVNAAGVLQPRTQSQAWAVHHLAPNALYEACERTQVRRVIHVSAVGVDETEATYARSKRAGEASLMARDLDWTVLRPAVVIGEDSHTRPGNPRRAGRHQGRRRAPHPRLDAAARSDPMTAWPEWVVRQGEPGGIAIAWVHAPDATTAARIADEVTGRREGWRTPGTDREVYLRIEHQARAYGHEYTAIVLDQDASQRTRAGRQALASPQIDLAIDD